MSYRLSSSAISGFKNCPKCFWLDKRVKIKPPRGIVASLMGGMDRVIKEYMDSHRKIGEMPPELFDIADGGVVLFPDQDKLKAWRNWRSGLTAEINGHQIIGAFDDLLQTAEGLVIPFDYKTKGKPADEEYAKKYYQTQLDLYGLMLKSAGYKVADFGVFSYWSPALVLNLKDFSLPQGSEGCVQFSVQTIVIDINPKAGEEIFMDAIKCIEGDMPESSPTCEQCKYVELRNAKV